MKLPDLDNAEFAPLPPNPLTGWSRRIFRGKVRADVGYH
jgi:hypothetical protein